MNTFDPGTKVSTYEPLWKTDLSLPRNRVTLNAWARSFYALDPDVSRIINQHALLIAGSFELIDSKSHKANQFCKQQLETLNIPAILETIVREYFVLGEAFLYLELSEAHGNWSRLIIQNPDYMLVKRSVADENSKYYLRPDENLRRICFSNREEDIVVRNLLSTNIVEAIKRGENILLEQFNCFHMAHKMSPYEIRGCSFLVPLFRTLKKENRDQNDLLEIRAGLGDILVCSNEHIAKDVLTMRYHFIFEILEKWFNEKLLAPVCKIQGFYSGKDKKLVCPTVRFDRAKLKKALSKIK